MTKALTIKQQTFIQEYLIDWNATQAAVRAGYSAKTAKEQASRLLTNVNVSAALREKKRELMEKMDLKAEDIIAELRRIGWFDIRKLFDKDGNMLHPSQLDDDTAAAIDALSLGRGEMRAHSKLRALELLGRHLNLWDKDEEKTPRVQIVLEGRDLLT